MKLQIDLEFKNLIPPLTAEEYSQLEKSILAEGCRDSIVIWNDIVIDGHNRYEICSKHKKTFNTREHKFGSRDEAKEWIILNQFGRRNLPIYERAKLALQLKSLFAEKAKEKQSEGGGAVRQKSAEAEINTRKELAKVAGVSHDTISKVEKIEKLATKEVKEKLAKGEVSINEAYKEIKSKEKIKIRKNEIEKQITDIENGKLPELKGLYDIIVVDPPWAYGREYDPETSRVANPYPEMSNEEIKDIKLPVGENAILFLWTTHKFLPDAFEIAKHFGFDYKAIITWNKEKIGMGAWFRMQTEFCLFCIKGKPFWQNTTERDIITEARRQHSRKPEAFYEMVNKICVGRKLDYFSREKRNGWDNFGNDATKF